MFPVAIYAALFALVVLSAFRGDARCRAMIARWAESQGLQLVSVTRRWFAFTWFWRSKQQRVYDVTVVDSAGHRRDAALLTGSYMFGSLTDQVRVKWRT
jgi:hypothetical protein